MRELFSKLNDIFDRGTKRKLLVAALGSVVVAALDTVAIALILPLVDLATSTNTNSGVVGLISGLLGNPSAERLTVILTVAVVGLFIVKDLAQLAFSWWMTGFVFTERVRTSARILRHFLTSPYTEVSRRSTADLIRAMDASVMQVFNYTVNGLMYSVSSVIAVVAIVVALFIAAPWSTLALVVYFLVSALVFIRLVKPKAIAAGAEMAEASLQGWRTGLAALGAIKELSLRGTQEHFVGNYRDASLKGAHAGRVAAFLGGLPKFVLEILFILAVGLILLVSVSTSQAEGGSPVSVLALFVAAGFRVLPSIAGLLGSVTNIRVGAKSLDIVRDEVLAAAQHASRPQETGPSLKFADALRVEGVTFRYPDGASAALVDVSLEVPRGSSTALVGGSGAGKTTLVDVILGLHDPSSGCVTVDGIDIADRKGRWGRQVGYVPQDVYLLDATLAENIAFDQELVEIDVDRLAKAIRQAQLDDVVSGLPEGVHEQLGEKGARLSGGQRQRVGIARALYREPQLLVLDEATSALDNETEHRISETIAALHGSLTVIIVAHRLSTVRGCDQIAFLKDGHVESVGTFDELRMHNQEFARLVALGSLAPLDAETQTSSTEEGER